MTARSGEKELAGLALQQPFGRLYSSGLPLPIHLGSNIFFPRSSLSAIFLSAFSHRPDWATRFSHRPRHGHLVIPHSDAGSRNTRLGHSALDAESRNTGRSTCKIHSLYVPFSGPRITCGVTRFSTRYPGYTRCLYRKKTAGSTVRASRDARTVRPESPFSFPAKEKGKPKESSRLMSES